MTHDEIREIRRRRGTITAGEWKVELGRLNPPRPEIWAHSENGSKTLISHSHAVVPNQKNLEMNPNWAADCEFLMHAPTDVKKLLDENQRLREKIIELGGTL